MYKRILVPIALDHISTAKASLDVARGLLSDGGSITLLNVIEDIPTFAQSYLPEGTLAANEAHAVEALNTLAQEDGHDYAAHIVHGKASVAILDFAAKDESDCIVITSHKPGLEDYFLGSNAARVVRHAKCCVHILR